MSRRTAPHGSSPPSPSGRGAGGEGAGGEGSLAQLACVAFACVAFAFAAGCKGGTAPPKRARPAPLVVVSKVEVRDVPVEVRAPIDLRPLTQADVGSKSLGYLDAVLVDRGDVVKRGQLVALVRPSDLPDQLSVARSTLAQTDAQVLLAQGNLDRTTKLVPSGAVTPQEAEQVQVALTSAQAAREAARAQVSVLATRLGETRIEAPMDGIVSSRHLDPGTLVGPSAGGSILTVVRVDVLRAFITVSERDLAGVTVGKQARIELDAFPGRPLGGQVVRMAPVVDPQTRTLDAEVQIPNPKGDLRPGMFGRGAIVKDVHPGALVVPVSAAQISDRKRFVFVLAGDKVERRTIEVGVDGGDWLEVTGGLAASDEIVTAGTDGLAGGMTVRVARGVDPYKGPSDAGAER